MTSSKAQSPIEISRSASGEKRLTELGIALPPPPEPFGIYVDAVQRKSARTGSYFRGRRLNNV